MSTKPRIYSSVPYLTPEASAEIVSALQQSLYALNDLHLTLKHIHWNVEGPNFISVHEMIDPQVDDVRLMADAIAERIAMLGGVPDGRSGSLVKGRSWPEYTVGRGSADEHLKALAEYFNSIIEVEHHAAQVAGDNDDLVTEGILTAQLEELEKYNWFARAHLGS
ncbi:MAG: DNA starvation/stationary phase protection protein [Cellulomonadaceae bacterium]|jgi:starvation-inducible DNA-binding protein|nr:DNA starvation/stationary phase protection protein [Cellulomonadaceae bacterium]